MWRLFWVERDWDETQLEKNWLFMAQTGSMHNNTPIAFRFITKNDLPPATARVKT